MEFLEKLSLAGLVPVIAVNDADDAVPLCKALFADVNPIPVKWAMNRLGWNAGDCRLPLVAPSAAVQAQLETAMQEFGLLK